MRPRQGLRILVVADVVRGRSLAAALHGMQFADVTVVEHLDEARVLCTAGEADACLLLMQDFRPDEVSPLGAEVPAPGRESGIPSLLLADVVTPYVSRAARRSGYVRAIATATNARMLYRRISAALQHARRCRARLLRGVPRADGRPVLVLGGRQGTCFQVGRKPVLH